jgi:fatty-acyl-CoA synthase
MTPADWIDRHAAFVPGKTAIRFGGRDRSYADLAASVARRAGYLAARGIARGDRVAWLGFNAPEMLVLLFACARLGAIFVPLNWRLARREHEALLADCGPKAVLAEPDFSLAGATVVDAAYAMAAEAEAPVAAGESSPGDPLLLCYTSGTTGRPKGALLTQGALLANAVNSAHMQDLTSSDVVLTTLPMFHVGGLNIQTLPALHVGATVVLHRRFDPNETFEALRTERPTLTVLVPTQLHALMSDPRWTAATLSPLRAIATGSTIVSAALARDIQKLGVPVQQVYGSTETAPIAAYQRAADALAKPGSTGKPALHSEMRIVDDAGRDVRPGALGEILVRGDHVMSGYWNDPEATRAAFIDGWFRTGDIGHFDADGDLWIKDRKKDIIVSGGENIASAEVEALLLDHPKIAECAVVGRPDAYWGEIAVAVIAPKPGERLELREVAAFCEGRLARYKHPRDMLIVAALPRNAMGKVVKDELRRMLRPPSPVAASA